MDTIFPEKKDNRISSKTFEQEQELDLDAQKAGAKLAADRRKDNTKLDLDLLRETTKR